MRFLLVIFTVFINICSFAQSNSTSLENLLQNPYQTLHTHLHNLQDENLNKAEAAKTIYAPNLSTSEKIVIAEKIKKILDGKGIFIDLNLVPKNPGYVDSISQLNIYFLSKLENRIYLEKTGNNWYYSESTVKNVDKLFNEVYPWGTEFLSSFLSKSIGKNEIIFGIKVWQVLGLLFIILLAIIGYWLIKFLTNFFINTFFKIKLVANNVQLELVQSISKSFSLLVTFFWISKFLPALLFSPIASFYVIKSTQIITLVFAGVFATRILSFIMFYFSKLAEKTKTKLADQLVPIVNKLLRIFIAIIVIALCLKVLEVDLVAILAGLSIGALALALAAQDTVKNFIGSITIFLDKPFEIGDYIDVAGIKGTVEEVGLRATRLRTPNQSIAYIPNGNLANMTIDNLGLRKYRRWEFHIGVEYGTSTHKIQQFSRECREILDDYPYTLDDSSQVRLISLGDFSLNIYVTVLLDILSFNEELRCKHELLLRLIDKAQELDVQFAFPTQTLHIEKPQ